MKNMKRMFLVFAFCLLISEVAQFSAMPIFVSSVFAQRDAVIAHFNLEASPPVQGVYGTIEIRASIGFLAPCCEGAEAYDVVAVLVMPRDLELVEGEEQQEIPVVACDAPGVKVFVEFAWVVSAALQGYYTVEVHLSSKNAGGGTKSYVLEFVEGPPVSSPMVNPDRPSIDDEIEIGVVIPSAEVNEVFLCYSMNARASKLVEANEVDKDYWNATIERQEEGTLTFHFEIQTIYNETFRSPSYELKVRDFVRIEQWKNVSLASYFGLLAIGIIIMFIATREFRRRQRTRPKHVPSVLRDYDELDYEIPEFSEETEVKPGLKWRLFIILMVLSITLLSIAVLLNEFEQLLPHLQGVPS